MSLAITDDHRALAHVVHSFAESRSLRRLTREAFDTPIERDPLWKQLCDPGWPGIHLPEEYEGSGYGLPEVSVVLSELGEYVAPGMLLAACAASAAIAASASETQRAVLLPPLAVGESLAALGLDGALHLHAGKLAGSAGLVLGAQWANQLVLAVGSDLVIVATDAEGVDVRPVTGLDPSLGSAEVRCHDVALAPEAVLVGGRAEAVRIARVLAAAESAGGAQACLAMALEYAKVREQFGRTIGSFQAVKHHLANMLVNAERATAVAWDAALAGQGPQGVLAAAVASAVASEAYRSNAEMNIQILGGIGFTWEHDAHLYLRRAQSMASLWAAADPARDDVAVLTREGVERHHAVDLPADADSFRTQARAFVAEYEQTSFDRRRTLLADSGYLMPHWPLPYGRAAGPVEQLVIETELAGIDVPQLGIGGWVLLTLIQQATPEQVARWIPPSLLGELVWCQLFSEPAAGSDAAAVQMKGIRVDGGWRVTGQKVWTSNAQFCNRGLLTVRTNAAVPKHKGITTMVVDMNAPGVDVRPLREITGEAIFNEVFFEDVFIPEGDVVGEIDQGWIVARATLGNERVSIGGSLRPEFNAIDLFPLIDRYRPGDAALVRSAGRLIADDYAIQAVNLRQVVRAVEGTERGAEGSVTKLVGAEHGQEVAALAMAIAGPAAIMGTEPVASTYYLHTRAMTIAGGTSEISRNVIAERLLGLPRDPLLK
ncbi:MAG: Acyl-CoA dehydrogenase [Mycobacterium sp.]|nr:Acyl-CoA dehydrogenase [Mycobacterium sp.]